MGKHDAGLKFYRAAAVPCPYLPNRLEEKILTFLPGVHAGDPYPMLGTMGFRRNHDIAYTPDCPGCNACQAVRVPVAEFKPNRTQRKILRRNADLTMRQVAAFPTQEQFQLFHRYQLNRHGGGEMSKMLWEDYAEMVSGEHTATSLYEWRDKEGGLQAVMLVDQLANGLSAVSSFFEPGDTRRSLGTYMILSLINTARQKNSPASRYVYLGFYVAGSEKMAYKINFQPIQVLGHHGWEVMGPVSN
jgi:arginine-tRNA-protein transferase